MTNTIPNVPRELLERVLNAGWGSETVNALDDLRDFLESAPSPANHVEDVRAMVAAPSPAGVDGLEVEAYLHTMHMEIGQTRQFCSKWKGDPFGIAGEDYSSTYAVTSDPLCRLSDAQTIIDGLRGEVERLQRAEKNDAIAYKAALERQDELRTERDQQAQRIGELEGLLRHAQKQVPTGSGLHMRIDAALAAVCAAAPNIAPTSEHSSQPERDPCPMCIKGGICNTPTCGRLRAMPKAY